MLRGARAAGILEIEIVVARASSFYAPTPQKSIYGAPVEPFRLSYGSGDVFARVFADVFRGVFALWKTLISLGFYGFLGGRGTKTSLDLSGS